MVGWLAGWPTANCQLPLAKHVIPEYLYKDL
jgi:hypothetical protein